jgi:hypothetical protein
MTVGVYESGTRGILLLFPVLCDNKTNNQTLYQLRAVVFNEWPTVPMVYRMTNAQVKGASTGFQL